MAKGIKMICQNPECERVFWAQSTAAKYCKYYGDTCRKRAHYLKQYAGKGRKKIEKEILARKKKAEKTTATDNVGGDAYGDFR